MLIVIFNLALYALGIAFFIAVWTGLQSFLTFLAGILGSLSLIGELYGVIDCCLPFSLHAVFTGLISLFTGVTAFFVTRKIFTVFMQIMGAKLS